MKEEKGYPRGLSVKRDYTVEQQLLLLLSGVIPIIIFLESAGMKQKANTSEKSHLQASSIQASLPPSLSLFFPVKIESKVTGNEIQAPIMTNWDPGQR